MSSINNGIAASINHAITMKMTALLMPSKLRLFQPVAILHCLQDAPPDNVWWIATTFCTLYRRRVANRRFSIALEHHIWQTAAKAWAKYPVPYVTCRVQSFSDDKDALIQFELLVGAAPDSDLHRSIEAGEQHSLVLEVWAEQEGLEQEELGVRETCTVRRLTRLTPL